MVIELRLRLDFTDQQLRRECVVQTYRASGPGGQHRNKTESAVRLQHKLSGVVTLAEESRSQHENLAKALNRLREALAVQFRTPLPAIFSWPEGVQIHEGRLRVNEKNPAFFHVLAVTLDALSSFKGVPQDASTYLGLTTSSYTRFLSKHVKAWEEANRIRSEWGLGRLKA